MFHDTPDGLTVAVMTKEENKLFLEEDPDKYRLVATLRYNIWLEIKNRNLGYLFAHIGHGTENN